MPAAKAGTATQDEAQDAPAGPGAPDDENDDDVEVDLDLDDLDPELREAIGQPTRVRLSGEVLSFPHMSDWPHVATRYLSMSLFDAWAEAILSEDDNKVWLEAKLHNYQVEKIVEMVSRTGGITPGKARRSSTSRGGTRKR